MKVTLAVPRADLSVKGKHDAGDTVDLPVEEARVLVFDGHARYVNTKNEPAVGGVAPAEPTTASNRSEKES